MELRCNSENNNPSQNEKGLNIIVEEKEADSKLPSSPRAPAKNMMGCFNPDPEMLK